MVLRRSLRRFLLGAAVILITALSLGAIYQFAATRFDESEYPPHGQLVMVDGRSVNLNCSGSGSPTVILKAGLGGGTADWELVQTSVEQFARVCSYDRAGTGDRCNLGGSCG